MNEEQRASPGTSESGETDETETGAGAAGTDEDVLESKPPSARTTAIRARLERLVPVQVGRQALAGLVSAGLAVGLLTGIVTGGLVAGGRPEPAVSDRDAAAAEAQVVADEVIDAGYARAAPLGPDGVPLEQVITVWSSGTQLLGVEDLAALGEVALHGSLDFLATSGLLGLCGLTSAPQTLPSAQGAGAGYSVFGSGIVSYRLVGATLRERVGPVLDVVTTTGALRGIVELARTCPGVDGDTVRTDGVLSGIGDGYAVFTTSHRIPDSPEIQTSIVVLVRVGAQLIEISLTPEGAPEVPDGVNRALRIAEAAVQLLATG